MASDGRDEKVPLASRFWDESSSSDIDIEKEDGVLNSSGRRSPWQLSYWIFWQILPWTLTLILSIYILQTRSWGSNRFQQTKLFPAQLTYSPAQEAIEYEVKVFEQNPIDSPREFLDPETVDKAWSDLYNFAVNSVPRNIAAKMTNRTSPIISHHPDQYVVQLDVFHQLHCLNMFRQALEEPYGLKADNLATLAKLDPTQSFRNFTPTENSFQAKHDMLDAEHLNHCLNSMRQSIQCHGDVAPVVWHWDENPGNGRKPFNRGFLSVAHTCRKWEPIEAWAKARQVVDGEMMYDVRPEAEELDIPVWP